MSDTDHAKTQLREHLASLLVPHVSEGFWSIQKNAHEMCQRNKQPGETIRTFQNMLTKIPEWTDSTVTEETDRILKKSKCAYMDDLLMGVFLSYMKSFASLQYKGRSSQVKMEFERPNVSKFILNFMFRVPGKYGSPLTFLRRMYLLNSSLRIDMKLKISFTRQLTM